MQSPAYVWLMLSGIVVTILFWSRLAKRDDRLLVIYVAALTGAFLGAKVVYILAEGWLHFGDPDRWMQLATGKSILGGLLGGYLAVEWTKRVVGFRGITGDWFALIVPVGILFGRLGCWLHGCCLGIHQQPAWFTMRDSFGVPRWPSVPVEILFNLFALVALAWCRRRGKWPGQLFHLYLIAYGLFRFGHEFVRDTPRLWGGISGYQVAALIVATWGAVCFVNRRNTSPTPAHRVSPPPESARST